MRRRSCARRKNKRKSGVTRKKSLRGGDISRKAMKNYAALSSQMSYNFEYYYNIANQLIYTLFTEWRNISDHRRKRDLQSINMLANDLEYLVTTRREKDLYDTVQRQVSILNKYSKLS
jgi:hypothetical protein